jgi:two-component system chemotaxis response regulator CheB
MTTKPNNTVKIPHPAKPIRVLAVDDSAFFRKVLTDILGNHPEIEFIGCASDAYEARDQLLNLKIDVLTLDLEMPRMGGLTFLKLLMARKPMPVIVVSSLTPTGSQTAVEALISGAYAVVEKPTDAAHRDAFAEKLVKEIKAGAVAPVRRSRKIPLGRPTRTKSGTLLPAKYQPKQIVALGASTGGTQALEEVLTALPANLPGILVVQHIPAGFSASFAARLNRGCAMEVREAKNGDVIHPGLALIAPGDRHMEAQWIRDHYRVALHAGSPVNHQRPSVDVLFESLAHCAGPYAIAALLTGMGSDGADGMKRLHDLHAHTIAQDADSSVVYGMARKAVELEAVDSLIPLECIAAEIVKALQSHKAQRQTAKPYAQ